MKWKLRAFDSVLKHNLLYGLERIQLTQSDPKLKGLRQFLKGPPAYTNQKALDILKTDHHHLIEQFSRFP